MKINKETTGNLEATIKIEIEEADYAEKLEKELREYRRNTVMPGFRPGKVPMGIIKKKYGNALKVDMVNKALSEALDDYIKSEKLELLGYPLNNTDKTPQPDFEHQTDFEFYFDIGLAPEINLDFLDDMEVEYLAIKASDDILNDHIEKLRDEYAELTEADIVEEGDIVELLAEELNDDGEAAPEGWNKQLTINTSDITDEETKNRLLKLKVDDTLVFNPVKAFGSKEEAEKIFQLGEDDKTGLDKDFRFTVKKINRKVKAEINEELFAKAFPAEEIKDEAQFRKRLKEELEKIYANESDMYFTTITLNKLIEKLENTNMPDDFLKRWIYVNSEGKYTKEQIEKDYTEYRRSIIRELLEGKLMDENESLRVSDDDIKNQVKGFYRSYIPADSALDMDMWETQINSIADNFMNNKENNEELKKIHNDIFTKKLNEFFKSKLKLNEKEVSYDQFIETVKKEDEKLTKKAKEAVNEQDVEKKEADNEDQQSE